MTDQDLAWYSVRTVVVFDDLAHPRSTFEERVTMWQARSSDEAIERAEAESLDYRDGINGTPAALAHAFFIGDAPLVEGSGALTHAGQRP